jgi:hypothetical protein
MMLGLQDRFVPFVEDGSKTHTIRARRKGPRQIVAGDRLDLYAHPRQKTMRLIRRYKCVRVEPIVFVVTGRTNGGWVRSLDIYVDGVLLNFDEASALAWRDGFRPKGSSEKYPGASVELMARFWDSRFLTDAWTGKPRWEGVLIHWRPIQLLN